MQEDWGMLTDRFDLVADAPNPLFADFFGLITQHSASVIFAGTNVLHFVEIHPSCMSTILMHFQF